MATASRDSAKVAVLGAGIMGSGIAQVAAMSGYDVTLRDVGPAELERGTAAVETSLARFAKSGKLSDEEAAAARGRLRTATSLEEAVDGAAVVIEAVPEILELKQEVLAAVAAAAPPDAILGSNTSQLSLTTIGVARGGAAERLVGTHFFNPPVMMRLVELVRGLATSDATLERARAFARSLGKEVVVCRKDSPGFITTRAYAALRLECLRILEEGIASAEDIDTALKLGFNLPMGPLELGDFNGHDSWLRVLTSLEEAHGDRFRPPVVLRNMVAAGRLGRKAGQGFYRYDESGARVPDDADASD
jgi:3-hydroxybutyryl-CoA dehydrogenase